MRTRCGDVGFLAVVLLAACGASDPAPDTSVSAVIGAGGGSVEGPAGVTVTIPAGALSEETTITVSAPDSGFPGLPAVASSGVVALEPHGLTFALPVTIALPHAENPNDLAVFTSSPGGAWERLDAERLPNELRVQVMHFSFFFNGREVCGLYRQECCADTGEGQCAGDALICIDNRCLECGLAGERCCEGNTCLGGLSCSGTQCLDATMPDAGVPDAGVPPAPAMLRISPNIQNFGTVMVSGTSASQTFTVANSGGESTGALATNLTGVNPADFVITSDTCTATTLAPAATCTVDIEFSPTSAGSKTASLDVTGTPGGIATADLGGTGI